ncbi:MarR family winged helix-turn-helix transcriptional regulator [Ilumatobacter sp.]|uniref:MarR family winged helix-turn-helix transcriptional regulator n=1 Tax=Ilumatobacter sp. TaxID=1967498 RepID=UPI003C6EC007
MMAKPDSVQLVADALLTLRRRQRRGHLAGSAPLDQIHIAEIADVVASHDQPVTVGDVARELMIDPSQASRRVASSVDASIVVRVPVQHDGRLSGLRLTRKGRSLVGDVQQRRRIAVEEPMQSWTQTDRQQLATLLTRLVNDLEPDQG